ncbi:hypothetical protein Poli38472_004694 [Pythium oligandrum]|uniref:Uncharacterized protein n=1 Tax=Pythium oligandrum TaxID=41045 RepID=A0A8K1FDP1_PYTOL|nr:hypothetical protein Poli38472_004694 [Pythium oligandrum]|eukprot:TMW59625.1 hypothetical protein Poli38472_004694 [Pythium oligandrum]
MARTPDHVRVECVGRSRLIETLGRLQDTLKACSFVAIDAEFGGLSVPHVKPSWMDSVETRYQQHRQSAQSFPIVEFGVSCFTWHDQDGVFDVSTFQFPIFPTHETLEDPYRTRFPDRSFLLQSKCIAYIRAHGFDLNEWVDHGIGYLSHAEQDEMQDVLTRPLREDIEVKFASQDRKKDGKIRGLTALRTAENRDFLEDARGRIKQLLDRPEEEQPDIPAATLDDALAFLRTQLSDEASDFSGWRAVVMPPLAPFRRFALMKLVETEFPHVMALDCEVDNREDLEILQSPWKRRLRIVAPRHEDPTCRELLQEAHTVVTSDEIIQRNLGLIGFTSVLDQLIASKKPVVGHNMLLDIMQCFEKFHRPLPETCAAFLHQLGEWLDGSSLIDTKILTEYAMEHVDIFGDRLEHSSLEHVFDKLSKPPFQGPSVRHTRSQAEDPAANQHRSSLSAHQAGYDAYMTGIVFLRVCSGLGVRNDTIARIGEALSSDEEHSGLKQIASLCNSFMLNHILPAVILRLPGPHVSDADCVPTPSRARFLRVHLARTHNTKLKPFHIQQCITWALNLRTNKSVIVKYESKTRIFVELPTAKHARELLAIRQETAESSGSEQDPMPSIGCVDIFPCEPTNEAEGELHGSDNEEESSSNGLTKRRKIDTNTR